MSELMLKVVTAPKDDQICFRCPSELKQELIRKFTDSEIQNFSTFLISRLINPENK